VEDPVRTLTERATPVDTGLLTPLRQAKGALLWAVLRPVGVALAILIGLVLVKQLIFATGRSLRSNTVTERTVVRLPRQRRWRRGRDRPRTGRPRRPRRRDATAAADADATSDVAPGDVLVAAGQAQASHEARP
jgi:hypothetical protein